MSMISGSDERVRNAFRANLLEEPSRPNMTQELDANDILEVNDLANAIERAERSLRTPLPAPLPSAPISSKRPRDIFDALATDDASGPAVHAPARPTPVPPPPPGAMRSQTLGAPATLLPAVATPIPVRVAPGVAPSPTSSVELPAQTAAHRPASPPVLTLPPKMPRVDVATSMEEDAYFHPGARIRGLADESLQIYRPEPTVLVRAAARRRTVTWVLLAVVPALLMLAAAAFFLRPSAEPVAAPSAPATAAAAATAPKPAVTAESKPAVVESKPAVVESKPVVSESKPAVVEAKPAVSEAKPVVSQSKPATPAKASPGEVPVFDVNSLPPARPAGRR